MVNFVRIGRVSGEEVGVLLNKLNGKTTVITQSGVKIYNGLLHRFYILDKTIQTLTMTESQGEGDRPGKDDLKIKTIDGSDVYVDLKVQFQIIPEQADLVLRTSGPDDAYMIKWARDYVRSIVRNHLGELKTEEFYNAQKRKRKLDEARAEINSRLTDKFGIEIDHVGIPQKPHFYEEYEEMIKKKKLADQEVLQEQSKALAARERQKTRKVEEENRKRVALVEFSGQMEQLVIDAKAEAERIRKEADAYYDKTTIGAEASFYQAQQEAKGILERRLKEAEALERLAEALHGKGGLNMVKLEYAKRLKDLTIGGQPFTREGHTTRFEHTGGAASSAVKK
jgi:regulator of protease activity HflC (stomatin/prohibitin superfamily)